MKLNVRKNKYGFSTRVKNKQNEEEISMFVDVQFKKDNIPEEESFQIDIKDGFFSCYKTQYEEVKLKLVVMDYEILTIYDNNQEQSQSNEDLNLDVDLDLSDALPF